MNFREHPWMGVFPAMLCAFHDDERIDEEGLRGYTRELCAVDGLKGLVCNGHTGEIMSLRPNERAEVTRIVAEEVKKRGVKIISHEVQRGIGASIRTAAGWAWENGYEIMVIMAGNDKDRPSEILRLTGPIIAEGYDFIQGSRYLKGGCQGNMGKY